MEDTGKTASFSECVFLHPGTVRLKYLKVSSPAIKSPATSEGSAGAQRNKTLAAG